MPTPSAAEFAREKPTPKEERWIRVLDEWKESGLSVAAFCRQHGLDDSQFWFWKREIPARRKRRAWKARRIGPAPKAPRFVPVRVVGESPGADSTVEVELAGGCVVRVRPGFDPELLRKLLSVLEGRA
jgi:transposase